AGPSLVEDGDRCGRAETLQEPPVVRVVPLDLDVGRDGRGEDQIERAGADDCIGDMLLADARVPDVDRHGGSSVTESPIPRQLSPGSRSTPARGATATTAATNATSARVVQSRRARSVLLRTAGSGRVVCQQRV